MGDARDGCLIAFALVAALASNGVAQGRKAEAELLFNQGKTEMTRGNFVEACKKFASSFDLSPRASTLMNLGACQEADKKLVSAWITFVEAGKLAERSTDEKGLAEPSKAKAKALEPRLSSLEIVVPGDSRVAGLEITRDGERIVEGQWNSEVYIDGGEYTIVARAPGTAAWTARVSIASELDKKTLEIPRLRATGTDTPPAGALPDEREPGEPGPSPPGRFTPMRKAAVAAAVVGVAAIAGGAAFGMQASGKQSDADAICPGTVCNDPDGLRLNDEAQAAAGKANLLFIGGGVAVAGGVALWVLGAPRVSSNDAVTFAPQVGRDFVGLSFAGGF